MKRQPKWLRSLGSTKNGVFVVNANQRILTWNKAAEKLLGYSASEIVNRHCYDVIGGRLPSGKLWCRSKCNVQRCVQRGSLVQDYDLLTATKEGRDVWVNISIIALPRKPKPLTLHLLRDVTRQERNEEKLQQILKTLHLNSVPKRNRKEKEAGFRRSGWTQSQSALSGREIEALTLLAEGMSSEAIAQRLSISRFTVRYHIQNAMKKLGLHNQAQAVSFAFRKGLL